MAASEVFRPRNGDLFIRDALVHGPALSAEHFRKEASRPQTQGGYRFGQLSRHSFFTRHNPHPSRVRHMKGLLDVPICCVNDEGYFASPRYSLQFPPNGFDNQKLKNWRGRIPVNAINLNKHLSTVAPWQSLAGLNNYLFREKAIPMVGLVPVTETWRDELAAFTRALGVEEMLADNKAAPDASKPTSEGRKRSTVYSPETGRIIPPPSRAVSRAQSRRGHLQFVGGNLQHISAYPDWENLVFIILCQILQTEDTNAVQAWLCSAGEREKSLVMDLVKNAIASSEEYYKQYPAEFIVDTSKVKLPPIHEKPSASSGEVNRLVLNDDRGHHPDSEVKEFQDIGVSTEDMEEDTVDETSQQSAQNHNLLDKADNAVQSTTNEGVRSLHTPGKHPLTPLQPARLATGRRQQKIQASMPAISESKIKYTKSSFKDKQDAMWNQNQSVNTF